MVFSSLTFIYIFLPAVMLGYYIIPKKWKNLFLLLGGIVFYLFGEPRYGIVLGIYILTGYLCALGMERYSVRRKIIFISGIIIPVGGLILFKYMGFFGSLPIGISFYTFQIISYEADVYKKKEIPEKNLVSFALYVSFFPQLIAGPIVRYSDIRGQIANRSVSMAGVSEGITRFIIGLGKKVLLADALGAYIVEIEKLSENGGAPGIWLTGLLFMFQIYFDFSGYSDMAIGLGKMLGFTLPENFNYPYLSKSVTEFWRRWHMTLGQWFRDYVYIPMGGNRVSYSRWLCNVMIVWALTGLWHGAGVTFLIWGCYFAVFLMIEKKTGLAKNRIWGVIYTFFVVYMGFIIFRSETLSGMIHAFSQMISMKPLTGDALKEFLYLLRGHGILLFVSALGVTSLPALWGRKHIPGWLEVILLFCVLILSSAALSAGEFHPFLYFRF